MTALTNDTPTTATEYAEIAVEQLTVYRFVVPLNDEISDPGAIALERFNNGDTPDLGPADGEQHELTTYYVGAYQPKAAQ